MRTSLLTTLALVAAYVLGTLQAPARAERPEELSMNELVARLVAAEKEQTEVLRTLSQGVVSVSKTLETFGHFGDAAGRQREQSEAIKSLANQLSDHERNQSESLRSIARAAERLANK